MRVEKWQALGNHFVLIGRDTMPWSLTPARARLFCDHELGIGADGTLLVGLTREGVEVEVRNRDGGLAEVSGNGTRIAVAHAAERLGRTQLKVRTGAASGVGRRLADGRIAVSMGSAALAGPQYTPNGKDPGLEHRFVTVGNPHCVVFEDDIDGFPLDEVGPRIEHHPWFPQRTNLEVVAREGDHDLRLRVWERGVGETQACGTGACAAAVAAVVDGRASSPVRVRMPGGEVEVEVGGGLELTLVGRAERVFSADLDPAFVRRLRDAG